MEGELPSQRITEGVIWKQLLFFFFPILLGSFFQQMYNTVDTIIVGRFVGTQALAAVGATSALLNLMNGFFIGLSTGATVLLSQFYGAKSKQGVQDALHTGRGAVAAAGRGGDAAGLLLRPQASGADEHPGKLPGRRRPVHKNLLWRRDCFHALQHGRGHSPGYGGFPAADRFSDGCLQRQHRSGYRVRGGAENGRGGGRHCNGFLSGGQRGDGHGGAAPSAGGNPAFFEKNPVPGRASETHSLRRRAGGAAIRDL